MKRIDGRWVIVGLEVIVCVAAIGSTEHLLSSSNDPGPQGITNFNDGAIRLMLAPYLGVGLLAVAWRRSWLASSILLGSTIAAASWLIFVCQGMLGSSIEAIRRGTTPPNLDLEPVGLIEYHLIGGVVVLILLGGMAVVFLAGQWLTRTQGSPA